MAHVQRDDDTKLKSEEEDDEVVYSEIVIVEMETVGEKQLGEIKKHISLRKDERLIPSDITAEESIDYIIPDMLENCGWTVTGKYEPMLQIDKILRGRHVAVFLIAHIIGGVDRNRIMLKIIGKRIPKKINDNPRWNDITSQTGELKFSPNFWVNLFKSLSCNINPEFLVSSQPFKSLSEEARKLGINSEERILPFTFLINLGQKNLHEIMKNQRMIKYLYMVDDPSRIDQKVIQSFKKMASSFKVTNPEAMEYVWTVLLSATLFRRRPIVPRAYRAGLLPMLKSEVEKNKEELEKALREKKRAEEDYHREAEKIEQEDEDGNIGAPLTENVGNPIETPFLDKEKEPEKPVVRHPFEPFYLCDTDAEAFVKKFLAMKRVSNPESHVYYIAKEREATGFQDMLNRYRKIVGISDFADMKLATLSMFVAMFGGKRWMDIHAGVLPLSGTELTDEAKHVFENLTKEELASLFRYFDDTIPTVGVKDLNKLFEFSHVVSQYVRPSEIKHPTLTPLKMILVIYYGLAMEKSLGKAGYMVDLWRSFKWSWDSQMASVVKAFVEKNQTIPIEILAFALALLIQPV